MRLTLSRVIPGDFDAIIPLQFTAFADLDISTAFFGKPTPKNYAGAKARLLKAFETDPADLWLKIVDEDVEEEYDVLDGEGNIIRKQTAKKVISASNWKIYPTYVAPDAAKSETAMSNGVEDEEKKRIQKRDEFTWLDTDQEREDGVMILENFFSRRQRACQEGHVLLFLLYVHPSYQRKGAGSMMMQWGNALADQIMLPCWVEASPYGEGLYRQSGYEDVERVNLVTKSFTSAYLHMRRPVKVHEFRGKELQKFQSGLSCRRLQARQD